ncbi:MAG: hypothetical protein CMJ94_07195 [Planctomycetes bacterium]|nr:hypothetical protein [Planctomycetota bacterium]
MTRISRWIALGLLGVLAFFLGRASVTRQEPAAPAVEPVPPAQEGQLAQDETEPEIWTCPMHPQIKLPEFGDCPICGMDLVLLGDSGDEDPRRLSMSPAAVELAQIQAVPAERRSLTRPVILSGRVDFDETRMHTIAARVPGRLDRLYVDATGVPVQEGDHLVSLYSPELLSAQEELIAARQRLSATSGEASAFLAESNQRAYQAAREKLLLWGLSEEQVDAIEERGSAEDHLTLFAPARGVVVKRFLDRGAYVQEGTPIYRLAELDHLWLQLDAFEQDLGWLRYGQAVEVEVEAYPGEPFLGAVSFLAPVVDPHTRTTRVRVSLENHAGRLKPGMFARAVVHATVGEHGLAPDRSLAGKWISPMHPEIVRDGPGVCDVCGMDLVPAESLGLVADADAESGLPLVVPRSAVLLTGKRAVVYVEVLGTERPTFEGREVVLGPRAGTHYVILDGLTEGERVVAQGAFRIDSAMQIQAKPSMMSMPGERQGLSEAEVRRYRSGLRPYWSAYLEAQQALAGDSFDRAQRALDAAKQALGQVDPSSLSPASRAEAEGMHRRIEGALEHLHHTEDLAALRVAFHEVSLASLSLLRRFGNPLGEQLHEAYCPMAFDDQGAPWVQREEEIANPYFGDEMLRCGELRASFPGHAPSQGALLLEAYLAMQRALAADDLAAARLALPELSGEIQKLGIDPLSDLDDSSSLETLRERFDLVSARLIEWLEENGNPLSEPLSLVHCPMAFEDLGADWLQRGETVSNPYFGAEMLRCGTIQSTFDPTEK